MIVKDDIICTECTCFRQVFNNDRIVGVCTANGTNIMKDSNIKGCCLYESNGKQYTEQPEQVEHDAVSHPSHYCKGGVECLDAIKAALGDKYEGFLAGNVLKYVYRYPDKNGVEDCRKAAFYLDKLIKELSDEE